MVKRFSNAAFALSENTSSSVPILQLFKLLLIHTIYLIQKTLMQYFDSHMTV